MNSFPFAHRTLHWAHDLNPLSLALEKLKKDNLPFIDLTLSNPTECGFDYFKSNLLDDFALSQNLNYQPQAHGLSTAVNTVRDYYREKLIELCPDQIFITANTSEAYSLVMKLVMNPGDFIAAPEPSYPLLEYLSQLNDCRIFRYPLDLISGRLDFSSLESESLKAFLVVHPNNPTGHYVQIEDRKKILEMCRKHSLALVSDEVFFDYPVGIEKVPTSFAQNDACLSFTLSGISKVLGLPQMKLSWIVVSGPKKIRKEAIAKLEILADTYLSASTPIQNAFPFWMKQMRGHQDQISSRIRQNYVQAQEVFKNLSRVEGGWSLCLKIDDNKSDEAFALELLEEERVLVHPGYLFDFFEDSPHIILSLLGPPHHFKRGLEIIAKRIPAKMERKN